MPVSVPDTPISLGLFAAADRAPDPSRLESSAGWAAWRPAGAYTVGVEEELMLIDPLDSSLSQSADAVLARLSGALQRCVSTETHAAVLELTTGIHRSAAGAVTELVAMRQRLGLELSGTGLTAACAGTHPMAHPEETQISRGERYRGLAESMRYLARREPTMALHVHLGVTEPDDAIRVLNGLCARVPILIALSANSPFSQGRDTGFCSTRTAIFGAFPRTGTPRRFSSYADYVEAIDVLIGSGALPDPTFLWWDVRLQPALGTVEVRAMDAQMSASDVAPLVALVHSVARMELEGEQSGARTTPEVLEENRFRAARDGLDARLVDPVTRNLVPVRMLVQELCEACMPHAEALGCSSELQRVALLAAANGSDRQRAWAGAGGLASVVPGLVERFDSAQDCFPDPVHVSKRSG